jgi:thiamine pyrophosphate-dependent acetolactate synthase large subunit-like protein
VTPVPSVANMVLHALGNAGADTVFGLPGAHNLAFWRGSPGLPTPRLTNVRHEQTAVYAADGWARASGRLGAAVVTTGPGAANTMAAFGEAAASGSPIVLIASEVPLRLTDQRLRRTLHQSPDQAGMFRPLAKAIFKPRAPQDVAQDLGRAIAVALTPPRGPVYMDIPTDVLSAPAAPVFSPVQLPAPFVDEKALDQSANFINSARSVAIWAGGGVVNAAASSQLASLAAHLQAPVFTTFSSRGVLGPADPCNVGLPPHEPEVEDLLASAEVLLGIGTDFDGMMTKNAKLRLPRTIIDVNVDLERTSFGYDGVLPVLGDAKVAIEGLLKVTRPRDSGLISALPALRQRVWGRLRSDPRTQQACSFVNSVEQAATGVAAVVNDMTIPGYWLENYYQPERERVIQYPMGWGTLGYSLPASIGAALSSDQPVLAVSGDGGFMFALGELATIVEQGLAITVLLVNDGGYGMLRYDERKTGEHLPGLDLVAPDFMQLAAAFGVPSDHVDDVGAPLEKALVRALAEGGPYMVLCDASLFPPKTTSPRWEE